MGKKVYSSCEKLNHIERSNVSAIIGVVVHEHNDRYSDIEMHRSSLSTLAFGRTYDALEDDTTKVVINRIKRILECLSNQIEELQSHKNRLTTELDKLKKEGMG